MEGIYHQKMACPHATAGDCLAVSPNTKLSLLACAAHRTPSLSPSRYACFGFKVANTRYHLVPVWRTLMNLILVDPLVVVGTALNPSTVVPFRDDHAQSAFSISVRTCRQRLESYRSFGNTSVCWGSHSP